MVLLLLPTFISGSTEEAYRLRSCKGVTRRDIQKTVLADVSVIRLQRVTLKPVVELYYQEALAVMNFRPGR
jgi:hypothetical protein